MPGLLAALKKRVASGTALGRQSGSRTIRVKRTKAKNTGMTRRDASRACVVFL